MSITSWTQLCNALESRDSDYDEIDAAPVLERILGVQSQAAQQLYSGINAPIPAAAALTSTSFSRT
jgi:hypothetical protein